jgi:hypothetical protein
VIRSCCRRITGWREFTGRKTANYRQIGNAFPPPVARAIGEHIRHALEHAGEAQELVERSRVTSPTCGATSISTRMPVSRATPIS